MNNNNLPHHLGGHENMTHVDDGALQFLIERYDAKSFLDVGCGPGGMVDLSLEKGLIAHGVDGDFTVNHKNPNNITIHDYVTGPVKLNRNYDIGWSCEFLEHVEEVYMANYMDTFKYCKVIAVTHAFPNQQGHHHVNLKSPEYWIEKFSFYGFSQDIEATQLIREKSTMGDEYIRLSGLVFLNSNFS